MRWAFVGGLGHPHITSCKVIATKVRTSATKSQLARRSRRPVGSRPLLRRTPRAGALWSHGRRLLQTEASGAPHVGLMPASNIELHLVVHLPCGGTRSIGKQCAIRIVP